MSAMTHEDAQAMVQAIERLTASVECLCSHVTASAEITAGLIETNTLLRNREEQIFGQLDRMELYMATHTDYPQTQEDIPAHQQVRARVVRDGKAVRMLHDAAEAR